jgi:crossover junction endodeoxyribonuclease RuvC
VIRVLGVDPGSAATGWALVVAAGNRQSLVEAGVIRTRGSDRTLRLAELDSRFSAVVDRMQPDCAAVESSFTGLNPRSSLSLAESRGVLLSVLGRHQVPAASFSPAEVKSAVVGHGRAQKQQVVFMVKRLLSLQKDPASDAADAMAVALTYLNTRRWKSLQNGRS